MSQIFKFSNGMPASVLKISALSLLFVNVLFMTNSIISSVNAESTPVYFKTDSEISLTLDHSKGVSYEPCTSSDANCKLGCVTGLGHY